MWKDAPGRIVSRVCAAVRFKSKPAAVALACRVSDQHRPEGLCQVILSGRDQYPRLVQAAISAA